MSTSSNNRFIELAASHSVVPLVRERLADSYTPISLAARLEEDGPFFLLESVEGGETWGRYSILGFNISRHFVIKDGVARLQTGDREEVIEGNPIDALQEYISGFSAAEIPGLPPFFGGVVGYFSFDVVRFFERCGDVKPPPDRFPDAWFMVCDHLAVFDNISHSVKLIHCVHTDDHASPEAALAAGLAELDLIENLLFTDAARMTASVHTGSEAAIEMRSNMPEADFLDMVRKTKEYIKDGDIIQTVVAQQFSTQISVPPLDIYRALRYINPSPYMYFLRLDDDRAIAGSSPEVMVRVGEGLAHVRPIAGTRPRGADAAADRELAEGLLADPKEQAEHVMLVDLARNDLGRVSDIGTVNVRDYMIIEKYSHVMHIVSHVQGNVRNNCDAMDVFKATFPAGTLSGAPKVRAMEIINELEPDARGPYGGALGYICYGGKVMDMAITIRTVVVDGDTATVTAGAGIVHDSVPETEYMETVHKSNGMRRALELAHRGLRIGAADQ
jgi:anthranilate synthase component 1